MISPDIEFHVFWQQTLDGQGSNHQTCEYIFFQETPRDASGEGSGTPLQYSCLENPMDGGAWQAAVHVVAKNQARLSNFTFTFMHWRRKWQPTPVFLPGESQGWGSLMGCCLWGRTESDTTETTQQQQQQQQQRCFIELELSVIDSFGNNLP